MTSLTSYIDEESSEGGVSESIGTNDDFYNKSNHSLGGSNVRKRVGGTTQPELAQEETKYIGWSKILVLIVLALATLATALGAYVYTKRNEELDFNIRVRTFGCFYLLLFVFNASTVHSTLQVVNIVRFYGWCCVRRKCL